MSWLIVPNQAALTPKLATEPISVLVLLAAPLLVLLLPVHLAALLVLLAALDSG